MVARYCGPCGHGLCPQDVVLGIEAGRPAGAMARFAAQEECFAAAPVAKKLPRLYLAMDGNSCPLRDRWRRDGSLGKLTAARGKLK